MMKHTFHKFTAVVLSVLAVCGMVVAADQSNDFLPGEKNCVRAQYRGLPSDFENLLKDKGAEWNFGFRPYSKGSASMLWTDPIVQREALSGEDMEKAVTALTVLCGEDGFHLIVFSGEPNFKKALAEGKNLPSGTLECFVAPGDADTSKIEHYYQFILSATSPVLNCYPWFVEDANFRTIEKFITAKTHLVANGYVTAVYIPWEPLFDRLPFTDKKDNFWRLSVIVNGQMWGGVVHQANQAGYIRWPDFTPAQRTAIRKNTLLKGWNAYRNTLNSVDINPDITYERKEPYYTASEKPHTFKLYSEDFGFRNFWLTQAVAERNALGAKILNFESLSEPEQIAFYNEASKKLFNFRYDVEDAYRKYLNAKLFSENTKR